MLMKGGRGGIKVYDETSVYAEKKKHTHTQAHKSSTHSLTH